jgi:hypothetical protein
MVGIEPAIKRSLVGRGTNCALDPCCQAARVRRRQGRPAGRCGGGCWRAARATSCERYMPIIYVYVYYNTCIIGTYNTAYSTCASAAGVRRVPLCVSECKPAICIYDILHAYTMLSLSGLPHALSLRTTERHVYTCAPSIRPLTVRTLSFTIHARLHHTT